MHPRLLHPSYLVLASFSLSASGCLVVDAEKIEGLGPLEPKSTIVVQIDRPATDAGVSSDAGMATAAVYTPENLVFLARPDDTIRIQHYDCDPSNFGLYDLTPTGPTHGLMEIGVGADGIKPSLPLSHKGLWSTPASDLIKAFQLGIVGFVPYGAVPLDSTSPISMVGAAANCKGVSLRDNDSSYRVHTAQGGVKATSHKYDDVGTIDTIAVAGDNELVVTHTSTKTQFYLNYGLSDKTGYMGSVGTSSISSVLESGGAVSSGGNAWVFATAVEQVPSGSARFVRLYDATSSISRQDCLVEPVPPDAGASMDAGPGPGKCPIPFPEATFNVKGPKASAAVGLDETVFVLTAQPPVLLRAHDSVMEDIRSEICRDFDTEMVSCTSSFYRLLQREGVVSLVVWAGDRHLSIINDIQDVNGGIIKCDLPDADSGRRLDMPPYLDVLPYLDGFLVAYGNKVMLTNQEECHTIAYTGAHITFTADGLIGTADGDLLRPDLRISNVSD